jgi:hypothetical protein
MAGRSVDEVLAPQVIAERFSRLEFPGTSISRLLGFSIPNFMGANPTGAVMDWGLRTGQYDIMDITRRVATGRAPGAVSSRQKPQKVGSVQFTLPRSAETIELTYEALNNRRQLGGDANIVDRNGLRYIDDQVQYMGQRFANMIEFQAAAMLRGSYTFTQNGDDLEQSFSGGEITVDFQIPAGNKDQLNLTGAGNRLAASWATPTTDIVSQIININSDMLELTGMGVEHILCRGQTWSNVINNDIIQDLSGSSQSPFETIDRVSAGEFTARLRAIPWITWHIIDYGLEIWNGSSYAWTPMLEADHVAFLPATSPAWVEYIRGMETVVEGPNGPKSDQYGFYSYSYKTHDPAGVNLSAVFNGLPSLKRPKAVAYGDTTP